MAPRGSKNAEGPSTSANPAGRDLVSLPISEAFKRIKDENPDLSDEIILRMAEIHINTNSSSREDSEPSSSTTRPTEIIPRDVQEQLKNIIKLDNVNWHSWIIDFRTCIECIPNIGSSFFKADFNPDPAVDKRLVGVIRSVCDRTTSRNIRYLIDTRQDWTSKELFDFLKEKLTDSDRLYRGQVLHELSRTQLINNDVERLVHDINNVVLKGSQVGLTITSNERLQQLRTCTTNSALFGKVWDTMRHTGQHDDYDKVVAALRLEYLEYKSSPYKRESTKAALSTDSRRNGSADPASDSPYWFGRRSKDNPDEPAKCYNCGNTGHISRKCPKPRRSTKRSAHAATTETSTPSAHAVSASVPPAPTPSSSNSSDQ